MRFVMALAAIAAYVVHAVCFAAPVYDHAGVMVDARAGGYNYAYASAIIFDGGVYHVFYCSRGPDVDGKQVGWDAVRYTSTVDGASWSAPRVVLSSQTGKNGAETATDRSTCDPSIVRFQAKGDDQPYYYMFYSANIKDVQTAIYVARSTRLDDPTGHPFAKWDGETWTVNARDPKPIIMPAYSHADGAPWYGAGEQTVTVVNGHLHMWYTEDSGLPEQACASRCPELLHVMSEDGSVTHWTKARQAQTPGTHFETPVDIKWDADNAQLVVFAIGNQFASTSRLQLSYSFDGDEWTIPAFVADAKSGLPAGAHNIGAGGDNLGHLLGPVTPIGFGAPYPGKNEAWGAWDMYLGLVLPKGMVKGAVVGGSVNTGS